MKNRTLWREALLVCMTTVLALNWGMGTAGGASIALFSTADCSSCNLVVPPGGSGTFYVRALTDGVLGLTGAGFRIVGLPPGWQATSVPNPMSIAFGDPFGTQGAQIGFMRCYFDPETCVDLYTVTLTASLIPAQFALEVASVPTPWGGHCRFFSPCCSPCDYVDCVDGGSLLVNADAGCSVGTAESHWTSIKKLYR